MTQSHDDKVMTRIKNLLAMAGDTSSPNEAAIAARRARKLMDEYQISEMDLSTVEGSDMGTTDGATGHKTASRFHGQLAVSVATINDCQVKYVRNKITGKLDIRFEGMLVDTVCSAEMFRYLTQQAYQQAERREQGRANRHAYRMGFAAGVNCQVKEIMAERNALKTTAGTALVVCKMAMVKQHFAPVKYRHSNTRFSGDRSSFHSGVVAGKKAGLNRQVNGGQRRLAG